jgi:hypothetical protein
MFEGPDVQSHLKYQKDIVGLVNVIHNVLTKPHDKTSSLIVLETCNQFARLARKPVAMVERDLRKAFAIKFNTTPELIKGA